MGVAAGIVIGLIIAYSFPFPKAGSLGKEDDLVDHGRAGGHQLTNPLLACGDIESLSVGKMEELRNQVSTLVDVATKHGTISHAAVYVRDLNNGPWMGLNEKEFFYPASLLKVPLIFAAYRQEELHPGFLDKKTVFKEPIVNATYLYPPAMRLSPSTAYSGYELLRRSIAYSDNESAALLGSEIGFGNLTKVFSDFGIAEPEPGKDYQMRIRTYASFFRVLYNASYISREHSEEALALLAKSEFKDGIVAGVPTGIVVAHKFGEREGTVEGGGIQLHDCGIVYAPERPYVLCIMAQGKTTGAILELMRTISAKTYATMLHG